MKPLLLLLTVLIALPTLAQEAASTRDGSLTVTLPEGFSVTDSAFLAMQLLDEASFSTFQVVVGQALYDSLDGNLRPQDITAYYENSFNVIMDAQPIEDLTGTYDEDDWEIEQLVVTVPNDGGIISISAALSEEGVPMAVIGMIPNGTDDLDALEAKVRQLLRSVVLSPEVPPALLLALSAEDERRFADGRIDPKALPEGEGMLQSGLTFTYNAEQFALSADSPISDSLTLLDEERKIALRVTELTNPTDGLENLRDLLTESNTDFEESTNTLDLGTLEWLTASPTENGTERQLVAAQLTLADDHLLYIEMVAYETTEIETMKEDIVALMESVVENE